MEEIPVQDTGLVTSATEVSLQPTAYKCNRLGCGRTGVVQKLQLQIFDRTKNKKGKFWIEYIEIPRARKRPQVSSNPQSIAQISD